METVKIQAYMLSQVAKRGAMEELEYDYVKTGKHWGLMMHEQLKIFPDAKDPSNNVDFKWIAFFYNKKDGELHKWCQE